MPNNPVQIVLNDRDFIQPADKGRAGEEKDFFEGKDAAFAKHKAELVAQVDAAINEIKAWRYGPAGYLRVRLREGAIARSYRPNRVLFTFAEFPCVGADAVGELYFRAPLHFLPLLRNRIAEAQASPPRRVSRTSGREYLAVDRIRCEVGAVTSIEIAPSDAKRRFSPEAAVQDYAESKEDFGYLVELFETPERGEIRDDRLGRQALTHSLLSLLASLGQGARTTILPPAGRTPVLELQLTRDQTPALIEDRSTIPVSMARLPAPAPADLDVTRHAATLNALAEHPLVRRIERPIRLTVMADAAGPSPLQPQPAQIPLRIADNIYPRIAVVDTGVSDTFADWIVHRHDFLQPHHYDSVHGSKVAAVAIMGNSLNGAANSPEADGCEIVDVPLRPTGPCSFMEFISELDAAVDEIANDHGVRIINLSVVAKAEVEPHLYSIYAARLDQIADRHGVQFVIAAGNLPPTAARAPWQSSPKRVLEYFAARGAGDAICKPAESVRSISVGALNPVGGPHLDLAPTTYTRRGPGLEVGVKPDVAYPGGAGVDPQLTDTGLKTVDKNGFIVNAVGTSISAPLVARSLATLDMMTDRALDLRTLRAVMAHSCEMPPPLKRQGMKTLARQFAGFGVPAPAADMLVTDDHQITLVFQSQLPPGDTKPQILRFEFEWPAALVNTATGACTGNVRMTLVYDPPLDPAFGAEFVRVNLDAALLQRQPGARKDGKPRYADQVPAFDLPSPTGMSPPERALIDQGLKWWPVKRYRANFTDKGAHTTWRLEVSAAARAETMYPEDGVPFSLVLTIEDPQRTKKIYQQFKQYIDTTRLGASDIRIRQRIRAGRS